MIPGPGDPPAVGVAAHGAAEPPAPDAPGALLLILAGVAWGVYSLRGRCGGPPLPATAGNFLRAAPCAIALTLAAPADVVLTGRGLLLVALSGAAASGLAYAAWYAVLPQFTAWRASMLQLSVPVTTALAAAILLGEALTVRLALATAALVGGVLLSLAATPRGRISLRSPATALRRLLKRRPKPSHGPPALRKSPPSSGRSRRCRRPRPICRADSA